MSRRGWDQLSDNYRSRLERAGIGSADYARGASLSGARGHGSTPERPERAESKPEYQGYVELRREVVDLKRQLHGSSPNYKRNPNELKGRSRAQLTKARDALQEMLDNRMSLDEFRMMYPEYDSDDWDWLGYYHG